MAKRTQQEALYDAQDVLPWGRTFASVDEVQRYLDDLREEHWWPQEILRVEVQLLRSNHKHCGLANVDDAAGCGLIGLRPDSLHLRNVAHELAHVINRYRGFGGHGPRYARAYLEIVYHLMGSDAYLALQRSFDQHDVVHDPTLEEAR